ncbi:UNVERIFIED_CONTAM: hypothetical protein RMT77_001100 [Armadillidium vulgare]
MDLNSSVDSLYRVTSTIRAVLVSNNSNGVNNDQIATEFPLNSSIVEECGEDVLNYVPSVFEFFNHLGMLGWLILLFASIALFIILSFFTFTVVHVVRYVDKRYTFTTVIVLTAYPALGLSMYMEILFPRSNFVLDTAAHLWFVFCMYHFFHLTLSYFGGESEYVASLNGIVLPWRGIPCCFWPCVWPFLPKSPVNKKQVKILKFFILQHIFIQAVFSIILFALHIDQISYEPNTQIILSRISSCLFAIATISFLFALWAFIISFKSSCMKLRKFKYCGKVATFQLCLVCFRFQSVIFYLILMPAGAFPCLPPMSPNVIGKLLLCSLVLGQLVILMILAHHFYKLSEADKKGYCRPPKSISMDDLSLAEEDKLYVYT